MVACCFDYILNKHFIGFMLFIFFFIITKKTKSFSEEVRTVALSGKLLFIFWGGVAGSKWICGSRILICSSSLMKFK
jgi:uncharacterized membrane protein YdcZ (DUF606 family)